VQTEEQDRRARMAKLERERAYLSGIYVVLVKELTSLKEGERTAVEGAQVAQEALDARLKEIEQLLSETAQAQTDRDARFDEAVALTDKLHEKEAELNRTKASKEMLQRQLAPAKPSAAVVGSGGQ
jgi:hypothetical protein